MTEKVLTDKVLVICYISIDDNVPTIQLDFKDFADHLAIKEWFKEHVNNAKLRLVLTSISPSQVYRYTCFNAKIEDAKHLIESLTPKAI